MLLPLAAFQSAAARRPEAPALHFSGRGLAYAALDRRAGALAHHLQARGVAAGSRVALLLPRCPAMVVALLATRMLGAVALPLDPEQPPERIAAILALLQPALTLGATSCDPWAESFAESPAPPPRIEAADEPAILNVTSGSAGLPKAVERSAGNIAAYARCWDADCPGAGTRTLMFSAAGVINGSCEVFATLAAGNCLVIIDADTRRDPDALLDFLEAERITRALITVSMTLAAAEAFVARPRTLAIRHWVLGTEPLRVSPAFRTMAAALPETRFVNTYGTTEAGPISRTPLLGDPALWPHNPDFGSLWPEVGWALEAGELVVWGDAVARGYADQPALTAERFTARPEGLAYRTGDLVRQDAAGRLHWLGRVDDQIKIGGNLIEPAEVEAALLEHPGIAEAVIAAQPGPDGAPRLVGFTVPRGVPPAPAALAAHLAARLPPSMIPALWQSIAELPRLPSGKLDRRALPRLEAAAAATGRAPASAQEIRLARAFAETLGLPCVSAEDDFFALGGDSLRALTLTATMRRLGATLPLHLVFEGRTVEGIARRMDRPAEDSGAARLLPLTAHAARPEAREPALIFIHAVGGMVFNYVPIAMRLPEYRCFGLQARGMEPGETPETDFDAMIEGYAAAIRRLLPDGPYRLFGYSFGGVIAHDLLRRLRPAGDPRDLLILVDAVNPAMPGRPAPRSLDDVLLAGLEPVNPGLARLVRPFLRFLPAGLKIAIGRREIRRFLAAEPEALAFQSITQAMTARIIAIWLAGTEMHERVRCIPHPVCALLLEAEERLPPEVDQVRGWEALTGSLARRTLPGNHFTMMEPRNIAHVVAALREALALDTTAPAEQTPSRIPA